MGELVNEEAFREEVRVFYMCPDAKDKFWRDDIRSCGDTPTPEEFEAHYDEVATLEAASVSEVTSRCDHASPYETAQDLIDAKARSIMPGDVVCLGQDTHIVRPRGAEKVSELNAVITGADE